MRIEQELSTSIVLMEKHDRYQLRANELRLVLAEIKIHLNQPELAQTLILDLQDRKVPVNQSQLARVQLLLGLKWMEINEPVKACLLYTSDAADD